MALIDWRSETRIAKRLGVFMALGLFAILVGAALWQAFPTNAAAHDRAILSIAYLADPDGRMTIAEVAASPDFAPTRAVTTKGYTNATHWLRLELAPNPTRDHLVLTVGVPNLDEVTLFVRKAGAGWTSSTSGDRIAYADRPWQSQQIGFRLQDAADTTAEPSDGPDRPQTVFLRVRTIGTSAMLVNVAPESTVYSDQARLGVIHAVFYGLMMTAMIIAIGLYIYAGDAVLLWFLASQGVYTLMTLSFAGYVSVLFPTTPTHALTSVLTILSGLLTILFHLNLLRRFDPARVMLWIGNAVAAAQIGALVVNLVFDNTASLAVSMMLTNFFMLFLAVIAYTARTAAHLSLRALRTVYTVYALSILIWILPAVGFGPSWRLSIYAVLVQGVVNLVLVLSMLGFLAVRSRSAAMVAQARLSALNHEAEVQAQSALAQRNLTWMLAHEVATSLSIIRLAVAKEPLSQRNAARVDRAISGLDQVMQHCLDADRIHAGKWQPTPARCDLTALCKTALAQFETGQHRIKLSLTAHAMVYSDPELVRLTFAHIIDNALKYAPPQSQVVLRLEAVARGYRFSVQNRHGAGAPPDVSKVFAKFYRDDRVLAQRGSGLGLFIVREIVDALGGQVDLEVAEGEVTAWIELGDMA
jgi:signal transduction histidine kinase